MISQTAKNLSSHQHINMSRFVGEDGQRKYYDSCRTAGLDIKKTGKKDDINHIDFVVDGQTVDVKGMKKTHKKGQILVEIKNVQGKDGWCSASKTAPTWISFDFGAFFLHVKNSDLRSLVDRKCDLKDTVVKADDALYKGYSRKDRKDLMTIVSLTDVIKECNHWFLPSEPYREPYALL
jgi:hypothetical protein